jgi:hypothetical protein
MNTFNHLFDSGGPVVDNIILPKPILNYNPVLHIDNFKADGFEKICNVKLYYDDKWIYTDIDYGLMYSEHNSWVYSIVVDDFIGKIGETAQPLGIRSDRIRDGWVQPVTGTKCRLGRVANMKSSGKRDDTDQVIRETLNPLLKDKVKVSIWAKKCEIVTVTEMIQGKPVNLNLTKHKDLELFYLNYFADNYCSPLLNPILK